MGEKYSYGDTPMNEIEKDILHADDDGTYQCGEHHVYFLRLLSGKKRGEYPTTIQTAGKDAAIIGALKILSDQGIFAVPLNYLIIIIIIQGNI